MNINEVKESLGFLLPRNIVPFITGQPGIGKSEAVRDFAKTEADKLGMPFYEGPENFYESGFGFLDFRASVHDVTDLTGLININGENSAYTKSPYLNSTGQGILLIDEFVQESQSKQASLNQLVLDRRVGTHALGDGWKIVTAGNRLTDRSSVFRMPAHTANRFLHIQLDFCIDAYVDYLIKHSVDPIAIAFARDNVDLLKSFDPSNDVNCTPRSFFSASKLVDTPRKLRTELFSGCVGKGVAKEFSAYIRMYGKVPKAVDIIAKPETTKIPSEEQPSLRFAVTKLLGYASTPENFEAMVIYLNRMDGKEYLMLFANISLKKNGDALFSNKAYIDLLSEYGDTMNG